MRAKSYSVIILLALIVFTLMITTNISCAGDNDKDPNNLKTAQAREKPMIIWFHSAYGNSLESLKTALSSGMISHVIVLYMHRKDRDWKANQKVRKAVEMVKNSDAKLIWCRDMWAYWAIENAKPGDLLDPNYYIQEIRHLRAEAKEMGADFVAFDTEPYGRSPMKPYLFTGKGHIKLSNKQVQQLKSIIKKTIQAVGKVDFILQAGRVYYKDHPWEIIAELGKNRISECTYYVDEKLVKSIEYPYEIFGAHLNTTRYRAINPKRPYFLVSDIFENSHLWSAKKGLFLYSTTDRCLAVAKDLVAYAKSLPSRHSVESKEPNNP